MVNTDTSSFIISGHDNAFHMVFSRSCVHGESLGIPAGILLDYTASGGMLTGPVRKFKDFECKHMQGSRSIPVTCLLVN